MELNHGIWCREFVNRKRIELLRFLQGMKLVNLEYVFWMRVNGVIKSWIYSFISSSIDFFASTKETTLDM